MPKISYIIPQYGDKSLLKWHLDELNKQSFDDFEVIIVFDGQDEETEYPQTNYKFRTTALGEHCGPAAARNRGVELAKSDIVMFVGDDCIPHKDLIATHYWTHESNSQKIVQGYTAWHYDVADEVTNLIDASGLQANWNVLANEDGYMRFASSGFCLTTNYSINKRLFKNLGGFNEKFTGAAWEDIEFGSRANKFGYQMVFEPMAVNWHYHRYSIESFIDRSVMEGYHRLTLCKIAPEFSWSLMNPELLTVAKTATLPEIVKRARIGVNEFIEGDIKIQEFSNANRVASAIGILKRLAEQPYATGLYYNVTNQQEAIEIISGAEAIETGHYGFAVHCAEWLITSNPDAWYPYAFAGEVFAGINDDYMARKMWEKALVNNAPIDEIQARMAE